MKFKQVKLPTANTPVQDQNKENFNMHATNVKSWVSQENIGKNAFTLGQLAGYYLFLCR